MQPLHVICRGTAQCDWSGNVKYTSVSQAVLLVVYMALSS